jgi:selenide,water dikinase
VGLEDPDDAAVWQIAPDQAIVVTTDFFTPVVDDPFDYGAIAAANALSDVYAMGGDPFLALNIAALPPDLPPEVSGEILRGGAEIARQAGVVIAGGHTIQDKEPKYGLVVLGFVHPKRFLSKSGARPGDRLVITKPLGFGTTTTALKRSLADPQDVDEAVSWMKRLNKEAARLANLLHLTTATDVTGFSLLGHAWEIAHLSNVGLHLQLEAIPFLSNAWKYANDFIFPGGASDNRLYFSSHVDFAPSITEAAQMLLFDPQTSGGLLLSVPQEKLSLLEQKAREIRQPVWVIGEVTNSGRIEVT